MASKLNCIVLIDDDESTNFLHKLIIERYECTDRIVVFQDARKALEFLSDNSTGSYVQPDLILLDINMPGMNGWEFLEAYMRFPDEQRGHIVVMMLTTSLNPDDKKHADSIEGVSGFLSKPLTKQLLQEILTQHFGW
jgi:CheY-like chemotaxis protein